jgi:hypothetical protein
MTAFILHPLGCIYTSEAKTRQFDVSPDVEFCSITIRSCFSWSATEWISLAILPNAVTSSVSASSSIRKPFVDSGKVTLRGLDELQLVRSELVFVVGRERVKIDDTFLYASSCIVRDFYTS